MKQIESVKEWGGWLNRYEHQSASCDGLMTFSVYLPPQAETEKVPVVYWLSGLTCTDDNVRTKMGAQRYAAELGLALVMPDTSPRGEGVADEPERYDLGMGAGFYVNATQEPWSKHYQMYDYVNVELPRLIEAEFNVLPGVKSISGHSMGGHGALISALKEEGAYRSVSAFSPICHPVKCGWGEGCFSAYLGDNRELWKAYDATELVKSGHMAMPVMIDQGTGDEFLADQLFPQDLVNAYREQGGEITMRMQDGYDHSYHFMSTFIGEHLAFHARALRE